MYRCTLVNLFHPEEVRVRFGTISRHSCIPISYWLGAKTRWTKEHWEKDSSIVPSTVSVNCTVRAIKYCLLSRARQHRTADNAEEKTVEQNRNVTEYPDNFIERSWTERIKSIKISQVDENMISVKCHLRHDSERNTSDNAIHIG